MGLRSKTERSEGRRFSSLGIFASPFLKYEKSGEEDSQVEERPAIRVDGRDRERYLFGRQYGIRSAGVGQHAGGCILMFFDGGDQAESKSSMELAISCRREV